MGELLSVIFAAAAFAGFVYAFVYAPFRDDIRRERERKESGRTCRACETLCMSLADCFDGIEARLKREASEPPIPSRGERFEGSRFDK